MQDSYTTIEAVCEGFYKEKGSKFMAFCHPVRTESIVAEHVDYYKKKYHDARHHCYAYRIGAEGKVYKANDDSEPSYTAGKPILGQIDAFELTDVMVVVVRYFGGTLLGKGGLMSAYKTAAQNALNKAIIVEKTIDKYYLIECGYEELDKVMRILNESDVVPQEQAFEMNCKINFSVRLGMADLVIGRFGQLRNINVKYLYTE